jgi:ATP-dependent Lon protease
VILPAENEPNVKEDLPENLLGGLKIHFVHTVDEALRIALSGSESWQQPVTPMRPEHRPPAPPIH